MEFSHLSAAGMASSMLRSSNHFIQFRKVASAFEDRSIATPANGRPAEGGRANVLISTQDPEEIWRLSIAATEASI
jgi:hypothetical protein